MDRSPVPSPERTRVLLECAEHGDPDVVASLLHRAGYEVSICNGPDQHHRCDLLVHGSCDDVAAADVVVNLLNTEVGDEVAATVSAATARPGQGLVVEMGLPSSGRPGLPSWPDDVEVIRTPITGEALLGAIRRAAERAASAPAAN